MAKSILISLCCAVMIGSSATPMSACENDPSESSSSRDSNEKVSDNPFEFLTYQRLYDRDMKMLVCEQIRLYRNAIYAQHNYNFNEKELKAFFSQFDWYQPNTKNVMLNKVEAHNITILTNAEKECE